MSDREQACAAQHFGLWMVQQRWMSAAVSAYRAGTLPKVVNDGVDAEGRPKPLYSVDGDGLAVIPVAGQIMKGESSFGGTSAIRTRKAVRAAHADPDAQGLMLSIDSPGGSIAGLKALADEVFAVRQAGDKPIHAHAEDLMASAALWVGVQAGRVTASAMTEVGSIGVVAVVEDTAEMAEKMGVKVHVLSTGPHKGAFAPGTEVTDEHLAALQKRVDEMNEFFLQGIKRGRGLGIDAVRALATGEDWLAAEAQQKGLIDAVATFEDAMRALRREAKEKAAERERAGASRRRRQRIAELA